MNKEELLRRFKNSKLYIACETPAELLTVVTNLIDSGIRHGDSGVSREIMESGVNYPFYWQVVTAGSFGGIEFYRHRSNVEPTKTIDAADFNAAFDANKVSSVDVMDLLLGGK